MTAFLPVHATHIVGGELAYECLGNDDYLIRFKAYRDCYYGQAPFDDPLPVTIFDGNNNHVQTINLPFPGSNQLNPAINNPCVNPPGDVCVEEAEYVGTVNLPAQAGGYHLVYQRCCRNNSINNINNPGNTGATYHAHIPDPGIANCNSSAEYDNFPPIFVCMGEPVNFDHAATDPNADSLVYELCTPYHGGSTMDPLPVPADPPPFPNITWAAGFSTNNPLDGSPSLNIDPQTGWLNGVPQQTGQFVVGVCVYEYRNGVLIDVNKRDFQFNVVDCDKKVEAGFEVINGEPGVYDIQVCGDLTVDFENHSNGANSYYWEFGDPTSNNDNSSAIHPSYTYPDTGAYSVILVAEDNNGCKDSIDVVVNLLPGVNAGFDFETMCELDSVYFENTSYAEYSNITAYKWIFGDGKTSSVTHPVYQFSQPGTYTTSLVAVDDEECADTASRTVAYYPRPNVQIQLSDTIGCVPFRVQFSDQSVATSEYEFAWDFGTDYTSDSITPVHKYVDPGLYPVNVKVTSPTGCVGEDTGSATVLAQASPVADFDADPFATSYFEPEIQFTDASVDAVKWYWSFDNGDTSMVQHPLYSYPDTGFYDATLTVFHKNGCPDTIAKEIFIKPDFLLYFPNAFTPNGDGVNDEFRAVGRFKGVKSYELTIWDRWGEIVFQTDKVTAGWNGRKYNTGKPVAGKVFVYTAHLIDYFDAAYRFSGQVVVAK